MNGGQTSLCGKKYVKIYEVEDSAKKTLKTFKLT